MYSYLASTVVACPGTYYVKFALECKRLEWYYIKDYI